MRRRPRGRWTLAAVAVVGLAAWAWSTRSSASSASGPGPAPAPQPGRGATRVVFGSDGVITVNAERFDASSELVGAIEAAREFGGPFELAVDRVAQIRTDLAGDVELLREALKGIGTVREVGP